MGLHCDPLGLADKAFWIWESEVVVERIVSGCGCAAKGTRIIRQNRHRLCKAWNWDGDGIGTGTGTRTGTGAGT